MPMSPEEKKINRSAACKKYRDKKKEYYNEYNKLYYQENKERITAHRKAKRLADKLIQ